MEKGARRLFAQIQYSFLFQTSYKTALKKKLSSNLGVTSIKPYSNFKEVRSIFFFIKLLKIMFLNFFIEI